MISITILTKNCSSTLKATLDSIVSFPEVIILDSGSTDTTLEVAAQFPNVKIFHADFCGFGPMHNHASSLATNDWIFSVDSDEVVPKELVHEIQSLKLDKESVYQIERVNFFNGKQIRGCSGWYPDPVIRLYHRKTTQFSNASVHEKIETKGLRITPLQHVMWHTPYRTLDDFISKMQVYSSLFALQNKNQKSSSFCKALLHGSFAFLRSYFWNRGFLNGKEGLIISNYIGQTAFYKYLKLAELNKK